MRELAMDIQAFGEQVDRHRRDGLAFAMLCLALLLSAWVLS